MIKKTILVFGKIKLTMLSKAIYLTEKLYVLIINSIQDKDTVRSKIAVRSENMINEEGKRSYHCYFELTLDIIGGKWKPIILFYIGMIGIVRYGELKRQIPSINERMLTRQLRELEKDQLITREVYREVPPRVEYSLTEIGKTIMPILKELRDWGVDYNQKLNIANFNFEKE
jgi:DNA-binding HxlR family transcriptional regulator